MEFKFIRDTDGVRVYDVMDPHSNSNRLGQVELRRGGWWRAVRCDNSLAGSWYDSRKQAAEALGIMAAIDEVRK